MTPMIRVTIKDKVALQSIKIEDFKSYLTLKGWNKKEDYTRTLATGEKNKVAEVWSMDGSGVNYGATAILVPERETLIDYAARMSENLLNLERIENRSQLEIYVDITRKKIVFSPTKLIKNSNKISK